MHAVIWVNTAEGLSLLAIDCKPCPFHCYHLLDSWRRHLTVSETSQKGRALPRSVRTILPSSLSAQV